MDDCGVMGPTPTIDSGISQRGPAVSRTRTREVEGDRTTKVKVSEGRLEEYGFGASCEADRVPVRIVREGSHVGSCRSGVGEGIGCGVVSAWVEDRSSVHLLGPPPRRY